MRIVQTFYNFSEEKLVIHNNGGWPSAEYHWFSWALSCLQLNKYYPEVALYADAESKNLLLGSFKLPYSEVNEVPVSEIPKNAWALVKIHTQELQTVPYLHIDGDVYIWKAFEEKLLESPLICQNIEEDFPFYSEMLSNIEKTFSYLPDYFLPSAHQSFNACNAGIIGGNHLDFLHQYAREAINFIEKNKSPVELITDGYFCMTFEQLLFYRMAEKQSIEVQTLISPVQNSEYWEFSDLHKVPYSRTYVHLMGKSKKKERNLRHLAKRLREDYPEYYYRILKCCQNAGITLDNQAYSLSELSPQTHDNNYFLQLKNDYLAGSIRKADWVYFYAKDMVLYQQVEHLFSGTTILQQVLLFDDDCEIIETTEPELRQTLLVPDVHSLSTKQIELDSLNMVLLDALLEPNSIEQVIEEISVYFDDVQKDFQQFQNLVLDRIKELLYLGALKDASMTA